MKLKNYWILYLAMVSVGMGQSVIFAVMPMLGRELNLHELVIAIPFSSLVFQPKELAITTLSALTALTFSLASPFWGRLSDRVGRKPVIVIGLLGYTFGMLLFSGTAWLGLLGLLGGLGLYSLLIVTRLVHSLVMSASYPASNAFIVDITAENKRSKGLGRLAACIQIGVMCGPVLAYLMMFNFLMPFLGQTLIMLVIGIVVLRRFPYHKPAVYHKPEKNLSYFDKRFRIYLMLALFVYIGLGMVQQTLGFYFQDVMHITGIEAARYYSLAMVASSGAMLFAQLVIVQNVEWSPQVLIRTGLPFLVTGFVTLALAGSMMNLVLGMALFGLGMGLTAPSFAAAASLTVSPQEQGALSGLVGSVAGMGFVFGPLLGGFIYPWSASMTYWFSAAAVLLAMMITLLKRLPGELSKELS